jgi:hypothetical protein
MRQLRLAFLWPLQATSVAAVELGPRDGSPDIPPVTISAGARRENGPSLHRPRLNKVPDAVPSRRRLHSVTPGKDTPRRPVDRVVDRMVCESPGTVGILGTMTVHPCC